MEDYVVAESKEAPHDITFDEDISELKKVLKQNSANLSVEELDIIKLRFDPFGKGNTLTLDQVGAKYGVTKERIRQKQVIALRKLREVMVSRMEGNNDN